MSRRYSLAYLTSAPLSSVDAISLAAKLGYHAVGIRIAPAAPGGEYDPLMETAGLVDEVARRMRDADVSVFDVEIVRIGADFQVAAFGRFLDVCARLGAKAILVAGDDPDIGRLTASYAAFCEAAAPLGISADLEFMPWTTVPDCKTAAQIVAAARQPNGGILVDALHAARSTTTTADIEALPRNWLHYAQICDAPAEVPKDTAGLIHTARLARLAPGDGGIDLKTMFAALPDDLPVSIEIPNVEAKARYGIEEWARRCLAASRACLEKGSTT